MRKFKYIDQDGEHIITEQKILDDNWYYWSEKMRRLGRDRLISKQHCIDDFCTLHWAGEIKDD